MRVHWRDHNHGFACGQRRRDDLRRSTLDPERVTCKRCLVILRNIGQVAEGKLRAAGEEVA